MRIAMYGYATRILVLSIIVALFTAALLYLALRWLVILHLTFVGSGLLFAAMDYIGNRAEKPHDH